MSRDRDRDAEGRPRSARPRDAAGRPLPAGQPDAGREPEEALPPAAALSRAGQLLGAGLPFRAHEVFEAVWKAAPTADRALWRGLAQVAVGLTHQQRGNTTGAAGLLRRGAESLDRWGGRPPASLDVAAVAGHARRAADLLEAQDCAGRTPSTRSTSSSSNDSSAALAAIIAALVSSISASASSS